MNKMLTILAVLVSIADIAIPSEYTKRDLELRIGKARILRWMVHHENNPSADIQLASELISFGNESELGVVPFLKQLESDLEFERLQNIITAAIKSCQICIEGKIARRGKNQNGNRVQVRSDFDYDRSEHLELCKDRIWEYADQRWKNHNGRLIARLKVKDNVMGLGWELIGFARSSGESVDQFLNKLRMDKEFQVKGDESDNLKERKQRIVNIIHWAIKKAFELRTFNKN